MIDALVSGDDKQNLPKELTEQRTASWLTTCL
jgi:hypothetical protein